MAACEGGHHIFLVFGKCLGWGVHSLAGGVLRRFAGCVQHKFGGCVQNVKVLKFRVLKKLICGR
jgi:hypothetical protein